MSLSVEPAGRSAAAAVISESVMRRRPVAPLGRKIGAYSCFCWSVSWVLVGVNVVMALPSTFFLALVIICLAVLRSCVMGSSRVCLFSRALA